MYIYFLLLSPLIAILVTLLIKKSIGLLKMTAVLASAAELLVILFISTSTLNTGKYDASQYFSVDAFGNILILVLGIISLLVTWYAGSYLTIEIKNKEITVNKANQFFVMLHLFIFSMYFAISTTSPILTWIFIEATTLSTVFLISFYNTASTIEAAWKYLIINSIGLLIGFFGTLLFLSQIIATKYQGLITWQYLLNNSSLYNPFIVKIAFIFVLLGYGTKVGFVPMHTWLPDAHSKAPAPISSLLSGVLLNVAFLAILRFKAITDASVGAAFTKELLIFFGLLSLITASILIFGQRNYKRLLAYSSIEHMGIIALGFGFGGAGSFGALLHMIYHALTKSSLFLSSGNIFLKYGTTKIANIKNALFILPATTVLFIMGFLAITGIPPFGTFVTEFTILGAGMKNYPIVVIAALVSLALVFAGFFKHVSSMTMGEKSIELKLQSGENSKQTVYPIIILIGILCVLSIFLPTELKKLLTDAVKIYE